MTNDVHSLCTINVVLPPWNELRIHRNDQLAEFRVVEFDLQMTPTGNALEWSVLINDRISGGESIEIEYPGTTSGPSGFNRSRSGTSTMSSPTNAYAGPANGVSSPTNGYSSPTNGYSSPTNGVNSLFGSNRTNRFASATEVATDSSPSYGPPPIPTSGTTSHLPTRRRDGSASPTSYPMATATGGLDLALFRPQSPNTATTRGYRASSPVDYGPSTSNAPLLGVPQPQGSPRPRSFSGMNASMSMMNLNGSSMPPMPPIPPSPRRRSNEFAEIQGSELN
jgi:hypothetical protein